MKKYVNSLWHGLKLMAFNWKSCILFIVFYDIVALMLYYTISGWLYAAALKVAGVTYLSSNTMGKFLLCPFSWLYYILMILLITFLMMFQFGGLSKLFDASRRGEKYSLSQTVFGGLYVSLKSIRPQNYMLFVYLIVMLPLMGFSLASNMGFELYIPGFIVTAIKENKLLYGLLCAGIVVLFLLTYRMMYSIGAMVYDDCSFKEAMKKSKRMIKNNFLQTVLATILTYILICAVFAGVSSFIGILVALCLRETISNYAYTGYMFGMLGVYLLGPTILLSQLAALYFEIAEEKNESLPKADSISENWGKSRIGKAATAVFFAVCLIFTITSGIQITNTNAVQTDKPEVAAHRGDSGNAPENTMPAFQQAIEDGCCDWIELDVHQTKDGVIVVAHDDSLSRIDGSNRYIHDMTYEELLQVDFGSRFSEEYAGTQVATLDEVLDYCKDKIKLQIEIKPTEYDDHIEEAVVDLIKDHDMVDTCVILSLSDKPLRKIKEIDPEIITMYCMSLANGDVEDVDFAEYISIEEQNVTKDVVNAMHAQNRKCFVWTIDSTDNIQHLIDCGVDVILTDYPVKIEDALNKANYSGGIAKALRLYLDQ